ncbi:MAG TPA: hypothetical protein VGW12_04880 [Pyrinomonadaceae bacterium]|nr:hypothetical protein [Pyrinomonadaceae bacterium]
MRGEARLSTLAVGSLLLLLLCVCGAPETRAQSGAASRPAQFVTPLHGEGFIAFRVEAAPTGSAPKVSAELETIQASLTPQVLLADNHVVHRVLVDAQGSFVFGYDLVVEPVAATKQFKVSVRPMSAEFEERLRARRPPQATAAQPAEQTVSTLPRSSDAQLIDDGDAFALDLLVNQQTGVKIVDVVKVSFERARLWSAPPRRSIPLRDFTLGNVELAMRDYKLQINGELVGGGRKPTRGCSGALVWFYVEGRGRFIFSLMPHEGYDFQKVGRIENNKISFNIDGDTYEWTSSAPVVGTSGGGNWNLWVLHDAAYVSDFDSTEGIIESVEGTPTANTGRNAEAAPEWLRDPLKRIRRERRVGFETRDDASKRATRRPRVLVGGADRIENLLPKR